jgi:DNA repair exonuclease SbcCD ATPase subunit
MTEPNTTSTATLDTMAKEITTLKQALADAKAEKTILTDKHKKNLEQLHGNIANKQTAITEERTKVQAIRAAINQERNEVRKAINQERNEVRKAIKKERNEFAQEITQFREELQKKHASNREQIQKYTNDIQSKLQTCKDNPLVRMNEKITYPSLERLLAIEKRLYIDMGLIDKKKPINDEVNQKRQQFNRDIGYHANDSGTDRAIVARMLYAASKQQIKPKKLFSRLREAWAGDAKARRNGRK